MQVFLFLFAYSFLFTCTKPEKIDSTIKPGGIYRIPYSFEISCLDPHNCGETSTWIIGNQIYENLVIVSGEDKEIKPFLADSFSVHNGSITFFLKPNIYFHDDNCFHDGKGRNLTAYDVKYSFERYFKIAANSFGSIGNDFSIKGIRNFLEEKSEGIFGIEVKDNYNIKFHLEGNPIEFLWDLTDYKMCLIPREAVEFYGENFNLHPVGTGPFRFTDFIPNKKLILSRNENYWDSKNDLKLPYLDEIEYILYRPGEEQKILLDFQTGKIDECSKKITPFIKNLVEVDYDRIPLFKGWLKEKNIQFMRDTVFHKSKYLEIRQKKKVRQSISHAINRERLVKYNNDGFNLAAPAYGPISPGSKYFNENLKGQFYDPEFSKQLLREAGFPGGKGLPEFSIISLPSKDLELIIEDLSAVGIKAKKITPMPEWRELLESDSSMMARLANIYTSANEALFIFPLKAEEYLSDSAFIRLYTNFIENRDNLKKKEILHRLEEKICEISPVVYLYHYNDDYLFLQNYVQGRKLTKGWNDNLKFVWLDK